MLRSYEPPPGRLIISVINSSRDALADAVKALERKFGRVECETADIPCVNVECYQEEMGTDLSRRLFSFESPVPRAALAEIKQACARIEPMFADRMQDFYFRTVNIDPGILVPDNLVMTSSHERKHRVYLGHGVFAEVCLIHVNGHFSRLPWTHPDLCHPEAIELLNRVRGTFEVAATV